MPNSAYSFTNSTTVSLTDSIAAGSMVAIFYTLKPDASSIYTAAPEARITALYYDSTNLYFGTENRKLYCLTNPATASNSALPQIKDIVENSVNMSLNHSCLILELRGDYNKN